MRTVRLATAACALLALAGCGGSTGGQRLDVAQSSPAPSTTASADTLAGMPDRPVKPARFGEHRTLADGLVITVATPKPFTPSTMAYPRAPRAVAVEIGIDNRGTRPYKPSQLVVQAMVNGQTAQQVTDVSQGYNGIPGAANEIPAGKSLRLSLAFAVSGDATGLRVTVQPDAGKGGALAVFCGSA